ncbi:MAG: glutamine amidotransferase [Methanomicrobiales archaeon HGW-Methanomicrobiales-3]|jgi:putative intracellular protease/amidase|nr:MAG: glutamine amidotransferase [Methanomicrobiales archaeon HGW-Methanomicrobiales-3]
MTAIFLYVTDTLADWECGHVLAELHSGRYFTDPTRRYDLVLCGRTLDAVTTMGGLRLKPDVAIASIDPGAGDLLLLPGADTWLDPAQAPVIAKVKQVLDSDAVVGAICGATMALANAGLLDERLHTSNDLAVLKMFCPGYHGEPFYKNDHAVTDGNLITAGSFAPVEFATQLFRKLGVMSPATLDAWHGLFTTGKPECFYALMASLEKNSTDP